MIINPFDNEQEFTSSDKLITHLTQLAVDKNNVFRGYGKQSELFPNIIREKDWREQEIRLLHEFERYGLQYFSANNPIDFMSYAQHYGLPTRLLDFTYNPFIALYFSLFTPKGTNYTYEEDRIYYYMRYCSLNDQIHIRTLPYFDETLFRSASFAVQSNRMIYLLNRIIRGLKEEADEHDTGVKAIVNYFARIYYDDHPSKSVESLTENPNFKKPNGYANIAPVGAFLKQSLPDFDIHAYGFSKLYDLIASFPDKYEIKKDDKNHAVPVALYRCK